MKVLIENFFFSFLLKFIQYIYSEKKKWVFNLKLKWGEEEEEKKC